MNILPKFSVVVACHNEAENVPALLERLRRVFEPIKEPYEVVLIDDGSTDDTLPLALESQRQYRELTVVELSRNFGHQAAVTAGFEIARGQAIILMDADLQDPPEVIPEMIAKWREGCDVAYGQRIRREGETLFKKVSATLFYRLFRRISKLNLPVDTGEFRLMDRKVVDALKQMTERQRFLRGMVTWIGYRQTTVQYAREARRAGETHYPLRSMLRLAWDAFASFSSFPIHCLYYAGMLLVLVGLVGAVTGFRRIDEPGHEPLVFALGGVVAVLTGILLLGMKVLGEYISRTYEETKKRPLYLVRQIHRAGAGVPAPANEA